MERQYVQASGRTYLVLACAAEGGHLDFHQSLGRELRYLAQHVDVGSILGKLSQSNSCVGYRDFRQGQGFVGCTSNLIRPLRWPLATMLSLAALFDLSQA